MDYQEAKILIVKTLQEKKGKSKFYFSDLAAILKIKPRLAKPIIDRMVNENVLEYWSSGSTTMYGLPGQGKQQI